MIYEGTKVQCNTILFTYVYTYMVCISTNHRLVPTNSVFQAVVPSGSMCIQVPDRAGPIRNHLHIVYMQWLKKLNG